VKLRDRSKVLDSLKIYDLLVMLVAFILAAMPPFAQMDAPTFAEVLGMRIKLHNFLLFFGFLIAWNGLFSYFGLYREQRLTASMRATSLDIAKAVLGGVIMICVVAVVTTIELITIRSLLVFWAMAFGLCILGRVMLRVVLRRRSDSRSSHLVIVGTNPRAVALAKRIEANSDLDYRLVGFVDEHWAGEEAFRQSGYHVVSNFAGFQSLLIDQVVDEVIVCTPVKSFYDQASRILSQCEEQGITVRFVSDVFKPRIGRSRVERIEDEMVVTIDTGSMLGPTVLVKRAFDISISLTLLAVLSPVFGAIALAIRLASPGPILFVQERVGLNKRRFHLFKFRTMVPDAEAKLVELESRNEVNGPAFKIKQDPRITPIGSFLRKTSLDELPQLINVLRGDMSLVGPRPLPLRDYRGFTEDWHRRRFSVRPGITCLWQVGGRNSLPFERWMELDMQYIDQWSLLLDFKILLRTIPAVLKGSGV
jgi:exopolysaccharide biosynthesis polyprenyl glycosylphosphotransferase